MRILVVLAIVGFGSGAFGLKCWSCDDALTNEECRTLGTIQTCNANEACVNQETTSTDGSRYVISKGCRRKNIRACRVGDPQNIGSYPTTCQYNAKVSVCSCCCNTDLCNGPQTECKDAITCRKPDHPGNGRVRCPKGIGYGSKCTVSCKRGFERTGPRVITCTNGTDQGYWNPRETVACLARSRERGRGKVTTCPGTMRAPEHGSMVCENQGGNRDEETNNFVGALCAFKCESGYFLSGPETTQCLPGGRWSIETPECKKGKCQRPRQDQNRIDQCSDENYFGSSCFMSCRAGFRLVGNSEVTCNSINDRIRQGRWSSDFPECVRAICRPQLMKPTNGEMKCTKKNLLGSICTFSCNDGFELTDLEMTNDGLVECVESGENVEWNGISPKCTKITCPRLEMPENGFVACIGDGSVGSKCTFRCNVGYDLVGTSEPTTSTECQNDGNGDGFGVWTIEGVTCAQVQCRPERTAPLNGEVYCTNGNLMGSVCTFTCNVGFDMDDTAARIVSNICQYDPAGDGTGSWSANPPTCGTRYYCEETQTDPLNGAVSCDNEVYLGSICQFSCEEGYELKGVDRITCRDLKNDGDAEVEWSSPAPECVPSTCPEQWYDGVNVNGNCNSEKQGNVYPVGTRCTYECADPGYYLEGDSETSVITCIAKNTWSASSAPRCFIKTCPRLEKIENGGQPECTSGNNYQSQCRYKCNAKYTPTHNDPLICDSLGRNDKVGAWDREPPQCILNECISVPPTPSKGSVVCSSGARLGSYCTLECDRGFAPRIARVDCRKTTESLNGETVEVPKFSNIGAFCCAQCRSEFHIVLAVDARFSRAVQNVIDFTKIFLAQLAGQDNPAYFSAFAYNAEVDSSSAIERQAIDDSDALSEIFERMEQWTIEEEGQSSDTRAALTYASGTMFSSIDSNAANFLIIAADDSPENVNGGEISSIRDSGINIIVAAGNNFAKIIWERLLGGGDDVVNQDSNEILNRIYDVAFRGGCSNMASECV